MNFNKKIDAFTKDLLALCIKHKAAINDGKVELKIGKNLETSINLEIDFVEGRYPIRTEYEAASITHVVQSSLYNSSVTGTKKSKK